MLAAGGGAFTFGVGGFHVLMGGLVSTSWSVRMAASIGPDAQWLVANGVMTALLSGAWGLAVLLLASLAWLGLRASGRRGEQPSYDSLSASVG